MYYVIAWVVHILLFLTLAFFAFLIFKFYRVKPSIKKTAPPENPVAVASPIPPVKQEEDTMDVNMLTSGDR